MGKQANTSVNCTVQEKDEQGNTVFAARIAAPAKEVEKLVARYGRLYSRGGRGLAIVEPSSNVLSLGELEQWLSAPGQRRSPTNRVGVEAWQMEAQLVRRGLMAQLEATESRYLSLASLSDPAIKELFTRFMTEPSEIRLSIGSHELLEDAVGDLEQVRLGDIIQLTTLQVEKLPSWRKRDTKRLIQALSALGLSLDVEFPPYVLGLYNQLRTQPEAEAKRLLEAQA